MADQSSGHPEVAGLLQTARKAQAEGRLDVAAAALQRALGHDGANPAVHNALGMQALAQRDFAAAAGHFADAAAADPAASALWVNLATASRALGDVEGERAALTRVLGLDQRHLMANIRLAELHERLGELSQAAFRWGAVLALAQAMPERPPALESLLGHAQSFILARQAQFGAILEGGLESARAGLEGRERRRFDACIDTMLGCRRIYVNECAGLHFPFLPADEFFDRAHFSWMAEIEARADAIRAEAQVLLAGDGQGFRPYVEMDPGVPDNKWSPLDKSLDWSAYFLWHHGIRDDAACRRCPETAKALEAVPLADMPRRSPTVFFSILRPHTRLPAHTGVTNARTIVHLPLIVPPGCGFRVGGETREWRVGEAFAFDDTIEHEAWNDSDEARAVLIFDVWNPHLTPVERALLAAFFQTADDSGFDPGAGAAVND